MYRLSILALALAMVSCGGDSKKETKAPVQLEQKKEEAPKKEKTSKGVTFSDDGTEATVVIEGNDEMKFNLKEIKVKEGQKVTLTLKHVGKMDLAVMGHNWALLTPGTDMMKFGVEASSAADTDYIPEGTDAVIVHTKMLGGGEQDTITFEAPAKGSYDFICSFPGHVALMNGKFIVE